MIRNFNRTPRFFCIKKHKQTKPKPKNKLTTSIIIGIDPGTKIFGVSILRYIEETKKTELINARVIEVPQTKKCKSMSKKLNYIYEKLDSIMNEYAELFYETPKPKQKNHIIIEDYFPMFNRGSKAVPYAQAIALLAFDFRYDDIFEHHFISPQTVKKAITGDGRAEKEIVKKEIIKTFGNPKNETLPSDYYDAIAIGYAFVLKETQ
jgi:Holliday junction resolvasome RuvABC endonuclease subunit